MKKTFMKYSLAILAFFPLITSGFAASNADSDSKFFNAIEGKWSGAGEVVVGKYKGTKFICSFNGVSEVEKKGLTLDGNCRVGLFSQPMKATVRRGAKGYVGAFNDGAKGDGLDIVSGELGEGYMAFALNRKQLNGTMFARLSTKNMMNITISVEVEKQLVPIVGMSLQRNSDVASNIAR